MIEAYEAVIDQVDLDSIDARERVTRHDVKARIEEFSALAGHEHIHKGMTSRDLTENVEQLQVRSALVLVRDRMVAALARLAERAAEHATLVMAGRSHNVPAQATTLGKRFANAGEELLQCARAGSRTCSPATRCAASRARSARSRTCSTCSAGDADRSTRSSRPSPPHLGFDAVLANVGQVYPRSLDLDVVSALVQAGAGAGQPGHHHPPDGRPRARHRGLPAGPGRARRPCRTR